VAQDAQTALDVLPSEGKAAASVRTVTAGRWLVLSADMLPVSAVSWKLESGGSIVIWEGTPGEVFGVAFIPDDVGQPLAATRVTLGGTPAPPPKPPDPPPPPPGRKWQVMFFHQSDQLDNLPLPQRELLAGLAFREELESRGHHFAGAFDVDAVTRSGKGDASHKTWWAAVDGDAMPRVALAPREGGDVIDFPLPADAESLFRILQAPP